MNHDELKSHIKWLGPQACPIPGNGTWTQWLHHCTQRDETAADKIRQWRHQQPDQAQAEMILWGVIAAIMADNDPRIAPWIGDHLTNLWFLAATAGHHQRQLHPVDHLISLTTQRGIRDRVRTTRAPARADIEATTDRIGDPTSTAALAVVELQDLAATYQRLTGQSLDGVVELAFNTSKTPGQRQHLRRQRQQLRAITA